MRPPKCQCPSSKDKMPPDSPADKSSNWEWPLPLLPLPFKLFTSRHAPSHSNEVVSSSPPPILIQVNQWSGCCQLTGSAPVLLCALPVAAAAAPTTTPTPLLYNSLLYDQNSQVLRIRL